ncbi:MAG: cation diffusion facilitator family transporter [Candidatus Peribacteria bacterium]|jgi:cation diffusion facilitator family transporter|nr:cation diffusion facilitator family transporter [Candidatus Peribacteria bacterium]
MKKNKSIIVALAGNIAITVIKAFAAAFSGSASLVSEAIHSGADSGNQIVLLWGKKQGRKKPDAKHQFGYARATFFASFCVAALLFFVGGAYSLMEAIEKIFHILNNTGEHLLNMNVLLWAAGILVISIIIESFSLWTAFKEVKEEQEKNGVSQSLIKFYKETRNSSLIVIITEDLTALLGLGLALIGVVLTLITDNPLWDAISGAAIGVLLIVAAFILGKEIASLIIGEALPEKKVQGIRNILELRPSVNQYRIKTVALGEECVLIEVDVVIQRGLYTEDITNIIYEMKQEIKSLWKDDTIHVSTCIEPVGEIS